MDNYQLKCERTNTEALLLTISVISDLFSLIIPHENIIEEKEESLLEELNNFRLKEALYCASEDLFTHKSNKEIEHIKTIPSEEFGNQSIHLIKKRINLDTSKKIILLDGHHRFSVINKYFMKKENKVPIIIVDYEKLKVRDHYYSLSETKRKDNLRDYLNKSLITTDDMKDYDISLTNNKKTTYYVLRGERNLKARFTYRDGVIKKYELIPSKPPNNQMDLNDVYFSAKAPYKEKLLSGNVFPSKSTWITPKFNPDLYKEYIV